MSLDVLSEQMKADWNQRAREDAKWYINTYKRRQSDDEFFRQGAAEVDALVRSNIDLLCGDRDPKTARLLEIGCGIGRMTRHLAMIFGEVVATDVSGEMVERCRRTHAALDNVTCVETSGYDFRAWADGSFDVIFSAYVYQHVPSAQVIRANLRDAFRVLRPGGTMHFFTNGVELREGGDAGDTWAGAAFPERDVRALSAEIGAQLVSVRGARRQYLSVFWRKPRSESLADSALHVDVVREVTEQERISRVQAGDDATVWMILNGLSPEVDDCERVSCDVDGVRVQPSYVGPVRFRDAERPQTLPDSLAPGARLVELPLPDSVEAGRKTVTVRASGNRVSLDTIVELSLERRRPVILAITNDHDGGVDIHRWGETAKLRVFFTIPEKTPTESMEILIDGVPIASQAEYLERNGYYLLRGRLPWHPLGKAVGVYVRSGNLLSPAHPLKPAGLVESTRAVLREAYARIATARYGGRGIRAARG
jgi:SAM-dependent methyltransferase